MNGFGGAQGAINAAFANAGVVERTQEKDQRDAKGALQEVMDTAKKQSSPFVIMFVGFAGHGKSSLIRLFMFLLYTFKRPADDRTLRGWGKDELPAVQCDWVDGTPRPHYYCIPRNKKDSDVFPWFADLKGVSATDAQVERTLMMCIDGLMRNDEPGFEYSGNYYPFWRRIFFAPVLPPRANAVVLCHKSYEIFPADAGHTLKPTWAGFLNQFLEAKGQKVRLIIALTFRKGLRPLDSAHAVSIRNTQDLLIQFIANVTTLLRGPHLMHAERNAIADVIAGISTDPSGLAPADSQGDSEEAKLEKAVSRDKALCMSVHAALQNAFNGIQYVSDIPNCDDVKLFYVWPTIERQQRVLTYTKRVSKCEAFLLDSPHYDSNDAGNAPIPDPWAPDQWENTKQASYLLSKLFLKEERK